jgi:hypothetical protein
LGVALEEEGFFFEKKEAINFLYRAVLVSAPRAQQGNAGQKCFGNLS